MSYIIEINDDGTFTLILPDDETYSTFSIDELLSTLRTYLSNEGFKQPSGKLLDF